MTKKKKVSGLPGMSNPVGNQKALVANKHIFPTKAFWFPTEFNNVKFSREPKGVSSK